MNIKIPELSLVLLIGSSGSGKSTFATQHFNKHEVVSSDVCRGWVSNDENNQTATDDAFNLLHFIISKRLKNGLLTVVDATNIQKESRRKLISLAKEFHTLPVAIILDLPQRICEERNKNRTDRNFGDHVIRQQKQQLRQSLRGLKREGFTKTYHFKSEEEISNINGIIREKLYNDKKTMHGPFDIIGDIHGCYDETIELLNKLNYRISSVSDNGLNYGIEVTHPTNRKVIFLGDLVDRGPASPAVLKLVISMVRSGMALCVPGNHDLKLQKKLSGKKVQLTHGLDITIEQLKKESDLFKKDVTAFLYGLISHYMLDDGKLVVAHAGIKEDMQGRGSGAVRSFCLYGETTGEMDEFGLPVRYNWALEYRGKAKVVYGHTPIPKAEWLNNTLNIDTGCVFGGELTAFRYPEEELVSVQAKKVYCEPNKPLDTLVNSKLTHQQEYDDVLNIDDVLGKRIIHTRLRNKVTIREENSIAALEVMSRFAINPKWLIYLPPTMSPCRTSEWPNFLEHPQEAFHYYKKRNIQTIVCEEKHMGSRVILIVCKNEPTVLSRFGIENEGIGVCYTRTGRSFFNDKTIEQEFIRRVQMALTQSNFWNKHKTDWACLDAEFMPWSAKAQALLKNQYAAVGSSAKNALNKVEQVLHQASNRNMTGIDLLVNNYKSKQKAIDKFIGAYRNYCWEVTKIEDFKLAPFHILATEGNVHIDKNHEWHMQSINDICVADCQIFRTTPYLKIDTQNKANVDEAIEWWTHLTEKGGEGMVVKPYEFISYGKEGLLQPAIKCRGSEYLRIIYGPEYDRPDNMERLKNRSLSKKRSLALREFALGIEGLERFVRKEPLRRVHECVFGVLALESEEIDPRL